MLIKLTSLFVEILKTQHIHLITIHISIIHSQLVQILQKIDFVLKAVQLSIQVQHYNL